MINVNSTASDRYFLYDCDHSVKEFQDYQAIILLQMEQK